MSTKEKVRQIGRDVVNDIVNNNQFQVYQARIKATQFRITILNESHAKEAEEILAYAFSKGGGNYEVIKDLNISDMLPITRKWVKNGIENGLCFVLLDKDNKVAFVGLYEVFGYDMNVDSSLKLSKNGELRRQIRKAFEDQDPVWQNFTDLLSNNRIKYGEILSPIWASRSDYQGHPSLSTLGATFAGLQLRYLYNKGVLKYFVGDATHWKTIAICDYQMKESRKKYGTDKYYYKSSTFDVNKYVKENIKDYEKDFVIDDKVARIMCMYVQDFDVAEVRNITWKDQLNEMISAKEVTTNSKMYNNSNARSKL